jgi:D-glycero-D-manno-heptose 1,7-bisphosphate phosphatase
MTVPHSPPSTRATCFLDRDGVIIEEVYYLALPEQVRLIPGSAAAIARLNRAGIAVVVVTNQSGVAQGYFPESRVAEIHKRLDELLTAEAARVDRYLYCPHHPEARLPEYRIECECRKPRPGMLLRAAAEMGLDLKRSWMVGDKLIDLQAGIAAGCRPVLVRTGYGEEVVRSADASSLEVVVVAADLAAAVGGLGFDIVGGPIV